MPSLKTALGVIVLAVVVLAAMSASYQIGPGERGVLMTWSKPSMDAVEPGLHFKIPFMQTVEHMNVQTSKYTATASSASNDLQDVRTDVTVNYHLDPDTAPRVYQNIGVGYEDKVIQPAVQEVVKAVTANYDASELITRRSDVKAAVDAGLVARLQPYGMVVEKNGVSITDFQFSEEFSKAIEEKVTAVQKKQKAENDLARIEIEAQQKIAQAKADQYYATDEMIKLKTLEMQIAAIGKWNGVMPQIMGSGEMPFLLNLPTT